MRDSETLKQVFLSDRERARIWGEDREISMRNREQAAEKYRALLKAREAFREGLSKEAHSELCRWPNNYSRHCQAPPFTPEWYALNPLNNN